MCKELVNAGKAHLSAIEKIFKHLEEVHTTVQVKGRGFYSKAALDQCQAECEELYRHDKALDGIVKAIKPLIAVSLLK